MAEPTSDFLSEPLLAQFIPINIVAAAAQDNTILAAQTGQRIKIVGGWLQSSAATTLQWMSDLAGSAVAINGPRTFAVNGAWDLYPSDYGYGYAASGKALNLKCGAATTITGFVIVLVTS